MKWWRFTNLNGESVMINMELIYAVQAFYDRKTDVSGTEFWFSPKGKSIKVQNSYEDIAKALEENYS